MTLDFASQNRGLRYDVSDTSSEERVKYKPSKIELNDILKNFGDLSRIFYKKLEQGFYDITYDNLYIVNALVIDENSVMKEIEYTFSKNELKIYSYSESKKDSEDKLIYYKFVSFDDDGKSILHSKEHYAINDLRIEICRDANGDVSEFLEEKGFDTNAFVTKQPTYKIKRDGQGNIVEFKEFTYDIEGRISSYKYIDSNKKYCLIENSYIEDFIITNYKNKDGITFWNRVFSSKVGKHTSESLFDVNGELIREEHFSYNTNGDLIRRVDKNADGDILGYKEIEYNENNNPILIISRNRDGTIKSEVNVA